MKFKHARGKMKVESTNTENLDPNNFLQLFQSKAKLSNSFKYIGTKNKEHIYMMPIDNVGSMNLIINDATIMARIGEDYAYFGIIYTLNGLEQFDATVLLLKKTNKGIISKRFDDSDVDFSDSKTKFATLIKNMNKENLDPNTYKDTGKAAPYGSGYKKIKKLKEVKAKRGKEELKLESGLLDVSKPYEIHVGDKVRNINPTCTHYKSIGTVLYVHDDGDITYQVDNNGATYTPGDELTKSQDQLMKVLMRTPRPGYGSFSNE